jgi:hypothetical protein
MINSARVAKDKQAQDRGRIQGDGISEFGDEKRNSPLDGSEGEGGVYDDENFLATRHYRERETL